MTRPLSTAALARELGVSEQTVRYHARRGLIPCGRTPGGHRRFDLDDVRAALARAEAGIAVRLRGDFPPSGQRLDLSDARPRELTEDARLELDATAGYDEAAFDRAPTQRGHDVMSVFAVPGSERYPSSRVVVVSP